MFIAIPETGTVSTALLFPLLAGGSLPPEIEAVFVALGTALLAMVTLMLIGLPAAPAAMTVELVHVTVCPILVHVQPIPPEPAAT